MNIVYSKRNDALESILERVKSMSLAHHLVSDDNVSDTMIVDGKSNYTGTKEIHQYLDKLSEELDQWYYCHC